MSKFSKQTTKQTTLFQSWGGKKHASCTTKSASINTEASTTSNQNGIIWIDDEDDEEESLDDLLLTIPLGDDSALYQPQAPRDVVNHTHINKTVQQTLLTNHTTFSKVTVRNSTASRFSENKGAACNSTASLFSAVRYTRNQTVEELHENSQPMPDCSDLPGFDPHAGRLWIYPTNYPVRDYQFNIVQTALFKNTLVALPTGLGKTFIAAVVMYNLYRWYPQGKVVFMAPTKPLVAQQIEACYNIMGIPQDDTAEMTGAMHRGKRSKAWQAQRVFYLTPQVLMNDISSGTCPATLVRCLVVDEAHKAIGNHAYCQVVKELVKYRGSTRILALSATPGTDIKAVQEVLNNLLISCIELRTEQSPDIQAYTHERKVEKVVVPLGDELTAVKGKYLEIVEVVVNRLKRNGVLYQRNVDKLSKFLLLKAREAFRQNPPENMQRFTFGVVEGDFALCLSLYHGLELLQQHGLRSLYNYLHGIMVGDKGYGRTRSELQRDPRFTELMESLCAKFQPIRPALPHTQQTPGERGSTTSLTAGHPKMAKLEELVLEHFQQFQNDAGDTPTSTRIMIFSQYRDSVSEITEMLNQHRPLVKVISFIGQSSVNKSSKGFTQKEQIRVMRQFREGGYNTLVSTCVGEEGLDIGDVDLIVCFDAHKSPIRLVQRMGRTGRKRKGRIIMLLTEGREEQVYNQSQYNKRSIDRAISSGTKSLVLYAHSERMVPADFTPRCHRMHMTVAERAHKVNKTHTNKTRTTTERRPRMTLADKKKISQGFLTAEEQNYWAENLYVDPRELPRMPVSSLLTLKPATQGALSEKQNVLSLDRYTPWQNTLQNTRLLGHSQHTHNLVELMQFMEVMAVAGESGADMYDTEMKSYLCNEDIILSKRKTGLEAFLQPDDAGQPCPVAGKRKRNDEDFPGPSRKVYKSDMLPGFSSSEDDPATDDESDLPDFHTMVSSKKSGDKESKKKRSRQTVPAMVDTSKRSLPSDKRVKSTKGKQKSSCLTYASDDTNGGSRLFTTISPVQRHSNDLQCVEVDKPCHPDKTESPQMDAGREDIEDETEVSDVGEEENKSNEQEPPDDMSPSGVCNPPLQGHKQTEFTSEVDNANDFFPFYTSVDMPSGISHLADSTQGHSRCIMGYVPPPPSEEELAAAMRELDSRICVSPVDILMLIDGWEREKQLSEVSRGFDSENNKEAHVNRPTKSPPSDLSFCSKSIRKTPKMSVATTSVKITRLLHMDSAVVGTRLTMNRGHSASETSIRADKQHLMDDSDDEPYFNITEGQSECEDVSGVITASQKQDFDITSVTEDRLRQEKDPLNEGTDSELGHERPTDDQALSKGQQMLRFVGKSGARKKINVHSESHRRISPVISLKCSVSSCTDAHAGIDTNMDTCCDTNMDTSLDTSHLSFTQALASVGTPSTKGKIRKSSANLKPSARTLFKSPKGKVEEITRTPDGHGLKTPLIKGMREIEVGVKSPREGFGRLVFGGIVSDVTTRSEISASGVTTRPVEAHDTPQRHTEVTSPRYDTVSPTLFDSDDDVSDTPTDGRSEAQVNVTTKMTTSADNLDVPNFSLLGDDDLCENTETCTEATGADAIGTVAPANVLDLPNFDLLDEDSLDELDFDLGFDIGESDEEMTPGDGGHRQDDHGDTPRTDGRATFVTSPQHHHGAVSLGRVSPKNHVSSAMKSLTSSSVKFKACSVSPRVIVPPTFVGGSLASTSSVQSTSNTTDLVSSVYDSRNRNTQREESVLTHTATSIRPGPDDTTSLDHHSGVKSVGSRFWLNLKQNHNVRFTENTERDGSIQQPLFKGRKTEQSSYLRNSLHEAGFRGRTMEQPGVIGKLNKQVEPGLGRSLSEGSLVANKATKQQKTCPLKSTTHTTYIGSVSEMDELWRDSKKECNDDFVKPHNVMRTPHQHQKTVSKATSVKISKKTKEKPQNNWFLDAEAAVSGSDDASSDEEDVNFDLMDASFIDDATQLSHTQTTGIDSRAMYLQSVRSPGWGIKARGARYKLSHRSHTDHEDVFSQESVDQSNYLQDSFCVDSDELEESGSEAEVTKIESADDDLCTPPRSRHPSQPSTSLNDGSTIKRKTKKRIVQLMSSSDEDCQDDEVASRNRSCMTTSSSAVVDRSRSCVTKAGGSSVPDGDVQSCKTKLTTYTPCTNKSHPTITTSKYSPVGQSWNGNITLNTRSPVMSYRNMTLLDKSFTSPAANVHLDVANRGSHHLTKTHAIANAAVQPKVPCDGRLSTANNHTITSTDGPGRRGKLVVFVDSREVNCAQDLMSSLRLKHDLHPIVRQLESCDYIVSARLAVERKLLSDFTNGTNKPKLIERIQSLCQAYERPCLIVETDRQNRHGHQITHKPLLKSRDVERTLACLAQSHVKILFSQSQDETADLLAELCRSEDKKNVALRLDRTSLETGEEQVLEFYLSLPKMTSAAAVSALTSYSTLSRFLHSSPAAVSRNSLVAQSKAEEIRKFVRHKFDIQMTPCRKLARTSSNLNNSR